MLTKTVTVQLSSERTRHSTKWENSVAHIYIIAI